MYRLAGMNIPVGIYVQEVQELYVCMCGLDISHTFPSSSSSSSPPASSTCYATPDLCTWCCLCLCCCLPTHSTSLPGDTVDGVLLMNEEGCIH